MKTQYIFPQAWHRVIRGARGSIGASIHPSVHVIASSVLPEKS